VAVTGLTPAFPAGQSYQARQSFAYNLKFSLNRSAQESVLFVFGKRVSLLPGANAAPGIKDVSEELLPAVIHRPALVCPRPPDADRDCAGIVW